MKSNVVRSSFLALLFSIPLTAAGPNSLNPADRRMIEGALESYLYSPVASPQGYLAHNPAQRWTAVFDARGFHVEPNGGGWKWGLHLERYGLRGDERTCERPTRVTPRKQGLLYQWDNSLEEWFVNDTRGLEHGFTLHSRPPGAGNLLSLYLSIRGDLQPVVQNAGRSIAFVYPAGNAVVMYSGLKAWDARGRPLHAAFRNDGPRTLRLDVDAASAHYPITIDPIAQQAYIKASNTGMDDSFGWASALSGDTLVVGAPFEDSDARGVNGNQASNVALNSGAAYVFVRSNGVWTQQAYLKASNTDTTSGFSADAFGVSVAIHGDTIAVGAPGECSSATGINGDQFNNNASASGAVYVFVRSGATWTQQAYIKASNTAQFQNFGHAVSISGDTLVVGTPFEDSSATGVNGNQNSTGSLDAGAAYVFVRTSGIWSQQAYLKASNTTAFDHFGEDVSISGDTIAVGAPLEDSGTTIINGDQVREDAQESGAVYVFVRNANQWSQQAYIKPANTGTGDQFGYRVSLSSHTLLVGSPNEDSAAQGINGNPNENTLTDSGAAYVFLRTGTTWSQQAYLKASNPGAQDYFGGAVALSAETAVVGTEDEDSGATGINGNQFDNSVPGAGAAYLFQRNGSLWAQQAYLKASNTGTDDEFGWSVAISGDTIAVASAGESSSATGVNGNQADNSASRSGAVYVFLAPATGLRFVPMTPCRLVDTRPVYAGPLTGAFGPPLLAAATTRTIPINNSTTCVVPTSAKAYVLNLTLDTFYNQTGPVDFVTLWPTGEPRPDFYTARTTTGGYIANAAIVKAGVNGAIDVYASHAVNFILDINGYFTDDTTAPGLLYYPIQPCRAVDTRGPIYSSLPPPYGNQRMQARDNRTFRIPGSPACSIPVATAYSVQLTLAPGELTNGLPVAFITAYPTGVLQPNISNMNAFFGYATANSAIVPASANGSIDVYAYDATNLIIDVNGYFAPDDGTGRGLFYFPARQCRVMNTQDATLGGPYGGPAMFPGTDRTVPVPAGGCTGLPSTAKAWALNTWVVPSGGMAYLSLWPSGTAWPNISQLNAFQGQTVANSGIVPASATGSVDIRVAGPTHVGLEVTGYFTR